MNPFEVIMSPITIDVYTFGYSSGLTVLLWYLISLFWQLMQDHAPSAPINPAPINPVHTDPAPINPVHINPVHTDPAHTDPAFIDLEMGPDPVHNNLEMIDRVMVPTNMVPIDLKQALEKQATTFRLICLKLSLTMGFLAVYIFLYWVFIQRAATQGNTDAGVSVMKILDDIEKSNNKCSDVNALKAVLENLLYMSRMATLYCAPMPASMLETTYELILVILRLNYGIHGCGELNL
jgi:hypothetical protein